MNRLFSQIPIIGQLVQNLASKALQGWLSAIVGMLESKFGIAAMDGLKNILNPNLNDIFKNQFNDKIWNELMSTKFAIDVENVKIRTSSIKYSIQN